MNKLDVSERYLVTSHCENDRPHRIVGSANKKQSEDFFVLFLRLLPGIPFYIVPHRDRAGEFLLFSGKSRKEDGQFRFFCKIGAAVQIYKKNVIEIHLPDLRQVYYLKLDVNDLHYTEQHSAA